MRFIIIFLLFISINSCGQNPTNYQYRAVRERTIASMVDSSWTFPRYNGVPSGLRIGSSTQSGLGAIDTLNHGQYFYSGGAWRRAGTDAIKCGLTCGDCGKVTWTGTGLNFSVDPAYYNLSGASYYFAGDSITLDAADGSFGRFDAIVLTSTGLSKVTGTASSDPQLPQFDPCADVLLTYVFVGAGATTPTQVTDEVIYDENTETWIHTTSGTISASFTSTAQAFHLTKSIAISSWSNNANIKFTAPSVLVQNNYTNFSFWIRLTAVMVNNQNISIQFFNGTTAVSNQVVATITKGNITTWQSASFSMSQFTFTANTFDNIHFIFSGNQSNTTYIDWVRLQAGITQPPSSGGLSSAYTRITDGTTTATATGGDIFKFRSNTPIHTTVTSNDAIHGDNVLIYADTSRSLANSLATNGIVKKQIDSLGIVLSTPNLQQVTDVGKSTTRMIMPQGVSIPGVFGYNFNLDTNGTFLTTGWAGSLQQNNSNGKITISPSIASGSAGTFPSYTTSAITWRPDGYIELNTNNSQADSLDMVVVDTATSIVYRKRIGSNINIYNSDGQLTGNRTVDANGHILEIDSSVLFTAITKTASGRQSTIEAQPSDTKLNSSNNATTIAEIQTSANDPFGDGKLAGIAMRVSGPTYDSYIHEADNYIHAKAEEIFLRTTSSAANTGDRYLIEGTYKTLTESSATPFVRVNLTSGSATGGEIIITVEANDGTNYQSRTLRFIWSAVNKAGTITATVQTPEEAAAVSSGTLTVTIDTNDAGSGNLDFRANAVSSLSQTTLRCSYQVKKNIGTGAITPQ